LVEGPHGKKILEEYWSVSSEKIYIAPLGIEIQQTKCTLPSSKYNFKKWLQVASFKSKKGQEFTITAFSEILKSNPRDTLTLVGTGTEKCKCMELVQNLKIEKAVNFIDHIPHQELLPFIAAHDVFIHPSVQTSDGDTEGGAPVILIEAQSMGVPVISTFHADIPHIVSDGVTGFLAEEGSVADLVDKMNQLILLPESSLKKMKVQAIDWVKERFNAIRCAENIETIYETILQKG
jgi:colanic acid/amylovoran biosynthesis glycosyltransferase